MKDQMILLTAYRYLRDVLNYKRKMSKGVPVIIYQMGKVGSMSVHTSLKQAGVMPLFHTHTIRHDLFRPDLRNLFYYVNIERKPAKFITLVREPVSRNVSSFFQNARLFMGKDFEKKNWKMDELISVFFDKFHHTYPLTWFDCELRTLTGIDVFKYPFKGHQVIKEKSFEVLVMKTEESDETKEALIRSFLEISDFKISRTNITEDKNYADLYNAFKSRITFPASYIDEMTHSKLMTHFYTSEEIDRVRTKWPVTDL